jgi:peptide deformylase
MAERAVLRLGDPRLLQISERVSDPAGDDLALLLTDLWDTMAARGGIGIAAPQIGVFRRVVVFGLEHSERYPEAPPIPRTVLINPHIEVLDPQTESAWEGCLSVPGMRGRVSRPRAIRYSGVNERGEVIRREVDGFHARVVQHECDHLDGILYPLRIDDLREFGFEQELLESGRY